MSDFDIREYRAEDIPALSRLWEKTFEDSPALIADFFRLLRLTVPRRPTAGTAQRP